MNTHRTLLTAAALLVSQAASAADFTSTYVGGTRNWSDPASWTTPGAPAGTFPNNGSPSPTTTFDAVQSSGTLTVDVPITIQALTLNNGTNRGAGSLLTLNDTFSWNGGTIDGTGTIQVGGSILLAGGTKSLAARTISLGGNSNWSSGDMSADSGAQIINEADKTFTTSFDGKCDQTTVTASAFVNNGIFTKSGAGGGSSGNTSTNFGCAFNNNGVANVNAGTLRLGKASTQTGVFNIAAGSTVLLTNGTHTLNDGARFDGAGTTEITNATNVNGTVTINSSFLMTSGSINSTGTLDVNGPMTWKNGQMDGNDGLTTGHGLTNINGGLTIVGVGNPAVVRPVNLNSNTNWTSGPFSVSSVLTNKVGRTFTKSFSGNLGGSAGGSFVNEGTFTDTGTGTTEFACPITNSGTINLTGGTFTFSRGPSTFNGSGTVNVPAGCQLALTNAPYTHNDGAVITGGGTTRMENSQTINGAVRVDTALVLTWTINVNGSGTLTVNGPTTWDNGAIALTSGGVLNALGGMTFANVGDLRIENCTVNISGNSQWTTGHIRMSGGQLINKPGGTFTTGIDANIFAFNGQGSILNEGTFTKSAGAGTSTNIQLPFTNSGTVNANGGTILFSSTYTQTAGALVLNGGSVSRNGGTFTIQGGKIQGGGTITGAVNASSGVTIEPGIGSTTGTLSISGDLTLNSGSKLSFDIGGTTAGTQHDQVTESGGTTTSVAGVTLEVNLISPYIPAQGDTFTVFDAATTAISGSFANVANGARLTLPGGLYTCQVNYGSGTAFTGNADKVILSHFATTPTSLTLDDNQIVENAPGGTTVGLLSATDPDTNETFTFSLVSGTDSTDNALFQITGNQLQAKNTTVLDFETKTSYAVRLRVTNSRGGFFEQAFTIQVQDVPAPTALALANSSFPENQTVGHVIGALSATNPPGGGDPVAFTVISVNGSTTAPLAFAVSGGNLVTNRAFNFESPPTSFNVVVRATNLGGESADQTFAITELDQGPSNLALTPSNVPEGRPSGTTVGSLSATVIPEGTAISTYVLVDGGTFPDNTLFTVEGTAIKTTGPISITPPTRTIRVRATDANGEAFDQSVVISIEDVVITDITLTPAAVRELMPAGTPVGNLAAVFTPAGLSASFELVAGEDDDDNALFAVDGGVLKTAAILDEEAASTRTVRVRATVSGETFTRALVITIQDNEPNIVVEEPANTPLVSFASTVTFPVTEAGTQSEPKVFTIRNTGAVPLTGIFVNVTGSQFSVTTAGMASTLAPGASTTFSARFNPNQPASSTGPESEVSGFIEIVSNDPETASFFVNLRGRAMTRKLQIEQPAGTALINGSTRYFGLGLVGTAGLPRTFTVTNAGESPQRGIAVSLQGVGADAYVLDNSGLPGTLAAGTSASFTVLFHPVGAGLRTVTLKTESDDFGDIVILLSGEGMSPEEMAYQAYLKASNAETLDFFGQAIAMDGNTLVIGAINEDSNATGANGGQGNNASFLNSGAVYVLVRTGGTWVQQAYLKASNPNADDHFGCAVAISGDTLVVGANGEDSASTGVNQNQTNNAAPDAGAAYVFVRTNGVWSQQAYLKASSTSAGDSFGSAVAISGNTVSVGAPVSLKFWFPSMWGGLCVRSRWVALEPAGRRADCPQSRQQ